MPPWLSEAWHSLRKVWTYDILTVEGETLSIGRIIAAAVLLFVAVNLSRRCARFIAKHIFRRFKITPGAVLALQGLTSYALLIFFALVALRLASVPLTIFAVLGGALAIGVGFGSQNVVNNFISGLILLIEQPVKPGDLIEVSGTVGTVESIGARSTTVRTPDNTHIVVPNSSFLENPVLNWTLSDTVMRSSVSVGVAYGSDTELVASVLAKLTGEHPEILPHPPPRVLFDGFGDNSLNFEVVFWMQLDDLLDRRRTQSELRFAIDRSFRQQGIVIAFPQRDVHLDVATPVEVKVVEAAKP